MGETCPICLRERGIRLQQCARGIDGSGASDVVSCYALGYEREKARADAAEANLIAVREMLVLHVNEKLEAQTALAAARRECEGLRKALGVARAVIDRDRTGLAAGLNAAINATRSYSWIANGEWSGHHYTEQNEKTLRAEVKNAFEEIAATAAKALSESGRLASESCRAIDAALAAPAAGDSK